MSIKSNASKSMPGALIYHADTANFEQLQTDMKGYGWSVDICNGMLEMLRLIEKHGYEIVVLTANHMNTEICLLMEMVKRLQEKPRILLNLSDGTDTLPQTPLVLNCPIVRGTLTGKKFREVIQKMFAIPPPLGECEVNE